MTITIINNNDDENNIDNDGNIYYNQYNYYQ